MKRLIALCLTIPLCFLAGGCIFHAYHETAYYDLKPMEFKAPDGYVVKVCEFENQSGAGRPFRLRTGTRISNTPYSKWSQDPGALVGRALNNSFSLASGVTPPELLVSGTLNKFEIDTEHKLFTMRGMFSIDGSSEYFLYNVKFQNNSAADYTSAASKAVNMLGEAIQKAAKRSAKK